MTKFKSLRKRAKTQMNSRLSEPEVDAALQLIQLSGDSSSTTSTDNYYNKGDVVNHKLDVVGSNGAGSFEFDDHQVKELEEEEESVGTTAADHHEISSSATAGDAMIEDGEGCPRRNKKFRSLLDIYTKTSPLIRKQQQQQQEAAGKNKKARIIR